MLHILGENRTTAATSEMGWLLLFSILGSICQPLFYIARCVKVWGKIAIFENTKTIPRAESVLEETKTVANGRDY